MRYVYVQIVVQSVLTVGRERDCFACSHFRNREWDGMRLGGSTSRFGERQGVELFTLGDVWVADGEWPYRRPQASRF